MKFLEIYLLWGLTPRSQIVTLHIFTSCFLCNLISYRIRKCSEKIIFILLTFLYIYIFFFFCFIKNFTLNELNHVSGFLKNSHKLFTRRASTEMVTGEIDCFHNSQKTRIIWQKHVYLPGSLLSIFKFSLSVAKCSSYY